MNVGQLKDMLRFFGDDDIIRFSYDYGDYVHTRIAHEVEFIDVMNVKKSEGFSDYIIDDNEEGEFIDDPDCHAVVLS